MWKKAEEYLSVLKKIERKKTILNYENFILFSIECTGVHDVLSYTKRNNV